LKTTRITLNTSAATLILTEKGRHLRGGFSLTCEGPGYCRWGDASVSASVGDPLVAGEIVSVTNEDHATPAQGPIYAIGVGGNCVIQLQEFF
jgi:hypothetical protein